MRPGFERGRRESGCLREGVRVSCEERVVAAFGVSSVERKENGELRFRGCKVGTKRGERVGEQRVSEGVEWN